jgi:hypothetical protein
MRLLLQFVVTLIAVAITATADAQSVTRSTFQQLERVQGLMSEENYAEAQRLLEEHVVKIERNAYDFALTNQ